MIGNNTEAFSIPASTNVKKFAIPFASPDNTPYRFPFIPFSSFGDIFLNAEIKKTSTICYLFFLVAGMGFFIAHSKI